MKARIQKSLISAVILSETIHVFCCVLPTLFSLMSLAAGLGLMATLPPAMVHFHDFMHEWELPIIGFSGFILALGWGVSWYSSRLHSHDDCCGHTACTPKKDKVRLFLFAATVLFAFNLALYLLAHRTNIVQQKLEHHHEAYEHQNL